jgi:hypothetical protein
VPWPPTLSSITLQNRHPRATFSAPRADSATIYFSTKPDRSTDGSFLTENIKDLDTLTDSEIQTGQWLSEDQLDPGQYWAMLRATPDFNSCWIFDAAAYDPACADGFSNVVELTVPKPTTRYVAKATAFRFIRTATLQLTAAPLGDRRPYRVCYRSGRGRTICLRRTLAGFSWNSSASDVISVSTRPMSTFTTFTWFVGTAKVATRRVRVR